MTLEELIASVSFAPGYSITYHGIHPAIDNAYRAAHAHVLFRGQDSNGSDTPAQAASALAFFAQDFDNLTKWESDRAFLEVERACRELWEHEFREWFRVDGVPVNPPHNPDGSFA